MQQHMDKKQYKNTTWRDTLIMHRNSYITDEGALSEVYIKLALSCLSKEPIQHSFGLKNDSFKNADSLMNETCIYERVIQSFIETTHSKTPMIEQFDHSFKRFVQNRWFKKETTSRSDCLYEWITESFIESFRNETIMLCFAMDLYWIKHF